MDELVEQAITDIFCSIHTYTGASTHGLIRSFLWKAYCLGRQAEAELLADEPLVAKARFVDQEIGA